MANFIASLLDGNDRSKEAHVILSALGFLALCVFQGYSLYHGQGFDPSSFGQSVAFIMSGGSVAAIGQGYLSSRSYNTTPRRQFATPEYQNTTPTPKPDNPDA